MPTIGMVLIGVVVWPVLAYTTARLLRWIGVPE